MARLRWFGPSVLGAAALVLALAWERIPERWVIHWSAQLHPNGYAHKGLFPVFMPLLLGAMVWMVLQGLAAAAERSSPWPSLSRAGALLLQLLASGLAALFAVLAVGLPLVQPDPRALTAITLALGFGPFGVGLVVLAREIARLKRAGHPELGPWRGLVYYDRSDPRLFVPKLFGPGYTLNFGRPAAPWVLVALLLPAIVVLALVVR